MAGSWLQQTSELSAIRFADDGQIPNNRLPLLIYHAARDPQATTPETMEALLTAGGWPPQWRSTVFTYHHFHSTAHEVLAIASGSAELMLGGPSGEQMKATAGDVIVIPAGVGHKRVSSSGDFLVVGGYPPGQAWDLLKGEPGERPLADANIAKVPMPRSDPVFGPGGPLLSLWTETH